MSRIGSDAKLLALGRDAFLNESGAALIRKHGSTGDPLFTSAGYADYADDLLQRMVNPFLLDRVDRIIRDPKRKLAWSDRLFGTMRVAMDQGITPRIMALGAAAAVDYALKEEKSTGTPRQYLEALWGAEATGPAKQACLDLVEKAIPSLPAWRA
jgi:mannitol-1-phosphate/altronate dehydrogenase